MNVAEIDERTTSWEVDSPRYVVFFWERGFGPVEVSPEQVGYACSTYEVTDAVDAFEVLAWATANSGAGRGVIYPGSDRTFVLYAAVGAERGLIRLVGVDPTR
jgi:hypothetical protein